MVLIVVDASTPRILSIVTSTIGGVRLTDDGEVALVEQSQVVQLEAGAGTSRTMVSSLRLTGRVTRIELATGKPLGEAFDPALAGLAAKGGVVCVGGRDDSTVVARDSGLFVIDWRGTPAVRRAQGDLVDASGFKCALASQ